MTKRKLKMERDDLLAKLAQANKEFSRLNDEIKELKEQLRQEKCKEKMSEILVKAVEKPPRKEIPSDYAYASGVIGKIVIQATKTCNMLADSQNENKKELINLILGKTEVAKAAIFGIVSSDHLFSEKKKLIDGEYTDADEYFKNILKQ